MASVVLENLSFTYAGSDAPTIRSLNLEIANGEAHALLGASGTGKTTLLNLLSGLLLPTSGRLLLDGKDVSRLTGRARNVAQVFQFPVLYESMSVAQNLAFPLGITKARAALASPRVNAVAERLNIAHLLRERASHLGLFEKQLVAVGKALVRDSVSLVLLDEPLTAVEPKIKWELRQTLLQTQHDTGVTMIYVTHDQTEALTFADRVSVLTGDGIMQTATPSEVYNAPAHEFVGHFVGSPGMNFLPATSLHVDGGDSIGFRPEWGELSNARKQDDHAFVCTVERQRVQGTRSGEAVGLTDLATPQGEVSVFGALAWPVGTPVTLRLRRYVLFKDGWKVGEFPDA